MKVLIIGAGRMGIRHALGAIGVDIVKEVCLADLSDVVLEKARATLAPNLNSRKLRFSLTGDIPVFKYTAIIIATPAVQRREVCLFALTFEPQYLLIEKPLGQSIQEVIDLSNSLATSSTKAFVNLNMRLYDFVIDLKNDIKTLPQFQGPLFINFTGGSLGIGANGIHYLDLLFYLFDAQKAEITAGEIEDTLIPSGRGPQFNDFGGWASINFFDAQNRYRGRSLIELVSTSTVFGGWEIMGQHGRIRINELEGERVDILRDPSSDLPVNRYAADYLPRVVKPIASPALSEITSKWLVSLSNGEDDLLPTIKESLKSHLLLFSWLKLSKQFTNNFPIT